MATNIYGKIIPKTELDKIKSNEEFEFIGMGVPVGKSGKLFYKVTSKELIIGQIRQLIFTSPGERVMLPNFGLDLNSFLFEPITPDTEGIIKERVINQITRYIPNVSVLNVRVFANDNNDPFAASELASIIIQVDVQERSTQQIIPVEFKI